MIALFLPVRIDCDFFRGSTSCPIACRDIFVTFRADHVLLVMALARFSGMQLASFEVETEARIVAAHTRARLVMIGVHLLKSLFSHRLDLLLIVETVCDFERYLLLLHGWEVLRVPQVVLIHTWWAGHLIERLQVSVRLRLFDCVGAYSINVTVSCGYRVILILVENGAYPFLTFCNVLNLAITCHVVIYSTAVSCFTSFSNTQAQALLLY